MRKNSFVPLLAVLVLAGGQEVSARTDHLHPTYFYPTAPSLWPANGNKIVVGTMNSLHAVYTDQDGVHYLFSPDPNAPPPLPDQHFWVHFPVTTNGSMPTVAVDASGRAHVVWIQDANSQGLGKIYYRRQLPGSPLGCHQDGCWSQAVQLSSWGTEPSLVSLGNQLFLTWSNRSQVRYATFSSSAPPSGAVASEVVSSSGCSGTQLHQPAVAVIQPTCPPAVPKIAFLVRTQQATAQGSCPQGSQVGPKVMSRNPNGSWSEVGSFLTPLEPPTEVPDPVSLSLASNPSAQSLYLAWSDAIGSSARALTTYSRASTWIWGTPVPLGPGRRHVHIRARPSSAGQFRAAVSRIEASSAPSPVVWFATGRWSSPSAPVHSWQENPPQPLLLADPEGVPATAGLSPQAVFWQRCTGAAPYEFKAYGLFDLDDGVPPVPMTYESSPCSTPAMTDRFIGKLCASRHTLVALGHFELSGAERGSALDFGEGVVTGFDSKGAAVQTATGGTIQVSWPGGKVLSSWENGLFVSVPAESLSFSSTEPYKVEDVGWLSR